MGPPPSARANNKVVDGSYATENAAGPATRAAGCPALSGSIGRSQSSASQGCGLLPTHMPRRSCDEWSAAVSSVEGRVEVRRSATSAWVALAAGERVCTGDSVRVESSSRATLILPDGGVLRLDEYSVLDLPEPPSGRLVAGAAARHHSRHQPRPALVDASGHRTRTPDSRELSSTFASTRTSV